MKIRLFVALEIPDLIVDEILELRDSIYGYDLKVKWEKRNKLHITLKFLGDTEKETVEDINKVLSKVITDYEAFECNFNKFGMFYQNSAPKILWIGTEKQDNLVNLQRDIEVKLVNLGFKKEKRKFMSHLTLLRVKGNEDINKLENFRQIEFKPVKFTAQKISLIQSELKPAGSVYTTIKSFYLK